MTLAEIDTIAPNIEVENLDKELCLPAMIFTMDADEIECDEPSSFDVQGMTFEEAMETEGLRYVGRFLVKNFPCMNS